MDSSDTHSQGEEWEEPMTSPVHNPGTPDDPMSPGNTVSSCPMSPQNPPSSGGDMSPEGYPQNPTNPMSPEGIMSPEDGPMSPDGSMSPQTQTSPESRMNPPSSQGLMSPDNTRSRCDSLSSRSSASRDGPVSPSNHESFGPLSPPYPRNNDDPSRDFKSHGGSVSPEDRSQYSYFNQQNPRSPDSPESPRDSSPDSPLGQNNPASPDSQLGQNNPESPERPLSPDRPFIRSPNESLSSQNQRSTEGLGSPRVPGSPGKPPSIQEPLSLRSPDMPVSPDYPHVSKNPTSVRHLVSPSNPASPDESFNCRSSADPREDKENFQADRLSEISEGDSTLNGDDDEDPVKKCTAEESVQCKTKDGSKVDEDRGKPSSKRRSDEGLGVRDELDFEAERESGEEEAEEGEEGEEGEKRKKKPDPGNREDGELSDEEEDDSLLRQEPKTVCRFFNKGQCTWGTNCRFLHPGVSDKGNYNMFAPSKPQAANDKEEESERGRTREVRRFVPEPSPFESAWERGLRYAKEMMKRANKRKETDADFEEKRFNLSLGQAELDRENDYYTRPASPVFKQPDEVIDQYLDPYEKQAIRHFRGGHFENFEVRYNVDPRYMRGGGQDRSRREKFEREVSERVQRRPRTTSGGGDERYVRTRVWQDDRYMEVVSSGGGTRGEAEAWADPWARRKTPPRSSKKKKTSRTRSYSSGSSSHSSSRSSRSSSYSSASRSRSGSKTSRTSLASRSSRSRSSSHSPSPGRHRSNQRSAAPGSRPSEKSSIRPVPPPSTRGGRPPPPSTAPHTRPPIPRRPEPRDPRPPLTPLHQQDIKPPKILTRERPPPTPLHQQDIKPPKIPIRERPLPPSPPPRQETKPTKVAVRERVDRFGRIRKDSNHSISRSRSRSRSRSGSRPRGRVGRTFSSSRSRSRSASRSSSATSRSRSRGRSISRSRSRSRSRSSYSRSSSASSVESRRRSEKRRMTQGTVSYGQAKSKAMDPMKLSGQKQQIKLTLKGPALKRLDKPVLPQDDDSGESDTGGKLIRKRKPDSPPPEPPPAKMVARSPPAVVTISQPVKKPQANRREELLKQLRAVEDAIARKRTKLPT